MAQLECLYAGCHGGVTGAVYKTSEDLTAAQALALLQIHEWAYHPLPVAAPHQQPGPAFHQQAQQKLEKLERPRLKLTDGQVELDDWKYEALTEQRLMRRRGT